MIKRDDATMVSNYRCEVAGLRAIAETRAIRVPAVYAIGEFDGQAWLAMEWVETTGPRGSGDRFAVFGQALAAMHQASSGSRIGWDRDNFLGSAHQPNQACDSWAEFVAVRRIGFQTKWATDQGLADRALRTDCDRIIAQMHDLLAGRSDETCLLHGDLWSGNYLFDQHGSPVLIDPAVYYGCREAEWGMITWLGNCPRAFEQAYQERWPMPEGWNRRVAVYRLYHQLNHLNLFGGAYLSACRSTAAEILR